MTRERVARPTQPVQSSQSSIHSGLQRSSWGTESRERSHWDQLGCTLNEPTSQPAPLPPILHEFTQIPVTVPSLVVQPKLRIGAVGDKYEQEADRVAAEVVDRIHGESAKLSSQPHLAIHQWNGEQATKISRKQAGETIPDDTTTRKMLEETKKKEPEPIGLQMKSIGSPQLNQDNVNDLTNLGTSIQQARGTGEPLPSDTQSTMEQAFGCNFSQVKIHINAQSDRLSRSVNARAFTTAQDIFFKQGEYNPGSLEGQKLLAHELTHVVQQTKPVQKTFNTPPISACSPSIPVIQRVETPDLPDLKDVKSGDEPDLYRNYLITLQAQLKFTNIATTDKPKADQAQQEITTMMQDPSKVVRTDLEKLIQDVKALTPAAVSNQALNLGKLSKSQEISVDDTIKAAHTFIDKTVEAVDALTATFCSTPPPKLSWNPSTWFDPPSLKSAKQNFGVIKNHLTGWKGNKNTRVLIAQNKDPGFTAYNAGQGSSSALVLSQEFLAEDPLKCSATIAHEASHGSLGTKDHGYMGAPYFFKLKDELALDNADHYAYALLLANDPSYKSSTASGGTTAASKEINEFQQAKALSYFKANQTWLFLMWTKDTYDDPNKNYVTPEALIEHAKLMGLKVSSNPTKAWDEYRPIRVANVQLLIELYQAIKQYLVKDADATDLGGNAIKMTPKDKSKEITVPNVVGKPIEEQSQQILRALAEPLGLPSAKEWDVTEVGEGLFKHIFSSKDPRYMVKETDRKVLDILSKP